VSEKDRLLGYFTAGAGLAIHNGALVIKKEGRVRKLVEEVEQVSFSGPRAVAQGQEILYVTERCVLRLEREGVTVVELAPGANLERDVLGQAEFPLRVAPDLKAMDKPLFHPALINLTLRAAAEIGA
jgi:propionate CoA-transferase